MPPQNQPARSADEQLSIVDTLAAQTFPEGKGQSRTEHGWGGPGYHIAILRATQDFWDDRSPEVVEPAVQELESDLTAIASALTGRWGDPITVDLWPYLGLDNPDYPNIEPAPEPMRSLCNVAASMLVWRIPSTSRWLGLTIGQGDRELPFELLAAVGQESSFPH
ncbi:hypothetical protein N8I84_26985 [Streptomyces cynarae]|uniref:Uncharacterized protein n=1 Tax=Streptomyces cynarae TaxID=2981134 RepID=A0ABY6E5J3_9ACTN|nr:hypothetical protein [Streptomyces cynarae]UXY21940.1 hypothetical protein N8I84_26985 [Streptomyces cynarae]